MRVAGLLVAVADKVGLTDALSEALSVTRERRSAYDPDEVVRDVCVVLADSGDCLADLGVLRDQEDLFGPGASNATAFRVIDSLAREGCSSGCARRAHGRVGGPGSSGQRPSGSCSIIRFSVGMDMTEDVRQAVLEVPEQDWVAAVSADGEKREGAFVAELSLDLSRWPEGSRAICRRERAHPDAQLPLIDQDGWRHQVFMTDQPGEDIALLDLDHRGHARVEDRIRCAKQTRLANLRFRDFALNEVWLELSLISPRARGLHQTAPLDGELARSEPKRLRHRLLHQAGRIARSGRRTRLRLERPWPWAEALVAAFKRIKALPAPAPP